MKGFLVRFARRYIAGTEPGDAIGVAKELNSRSIKAAIDNLGENVKVQAEASEAVSEYIRLLGEIKKAKVDSTVSLKLTQMGLDISEELAEKNAEKVIRKAAALNNSVRLDMESSAYTDRTISVFLKLHKKYPATGIAIQSALKRSASDIDALIKEGASVRLVKGAYKESADIAFEDKADVDKNYEKLMKELLLKGINPAIATHDERIIEEAIRFSEKHKIGKDAFTFEMLLGIKRTLQSRLASDGFNVRVYVPYGKNWLAYTLRRLRERKENIYFVVKNIFD